MYDTIIIGAGMSGLAAGIRLAHFEQKVCVLEKHTTIGGLNSFYRLNRRDYDVGLHAVTNFTEKGTKKGPLAKLLRQLRFKWEDFALSPQLGSEIAFPGVRLKFTNDPEVLASEIEKKFPRERDRYRALLGKILDYDDLDDAAFQISARKILEETLSDPLLIEMLLCPLMWYGNARERDMDWGQFCIMFRALYLEGLARPFKGVRLILKNLVKKFRGLGGELRLRTGVKEIRTENGRAVGVVLENGEELRAKRILSSAGRLETLKLCDDLTVVDQAQAGNLSFVETVSILDRLPQQLGHDRTIVFYNDSEKFHWERPDKTPVDLRTGVICSPNNFDYPQGELLEEGVIRVTAIADWDAWGKMSEPEYRLAKHEWFDRVNASAVRFMPDFRRRIVASDMFTPTTIRRFTWHENGAVYGAPEKVLDGRTHLDNLYLCGTDQGYIGIIGSIVSGISMANRWCLADQSTAP